MELEMNPFSLAFRSPQVEGEFLQVGVYELADCISSMLRQSIAVDGSSWRQHNSQRSRACSTLHGSARVV
jgi:hypothetical protein